MNGQSPRPSPLDWVDLMEKSAENVQVNIQTLDSIPTEKVINNTFVPQLLKFGHNFLFNGFLYFYGSTHSRFSLKAS
uniref:Uncharacterized protein n=1 Tax=Oreochromis niloticus TaxID=8128 RepID=A0A669CU65_ORENI